VRIYLSICLYLCLSTGVSRYISVRIYVYTLSNSRSLLQKSRIKDIYICLCLCLRLCFCPSCPSVCQFVCTCVHVCSHMSTHVCACVRVYLCIFALSHVHAYLQYYQAAKQAKAIEARLHIASLSSRPFSARIHYTAQEVGCPGERETKMKVVQQNICVSHSLPR